MQVSNFARSRGVTAGMKLQMIARMLLTLIGVVAIAAAADVSGKWKAQIPGRGGNTNETTFNFKADGDKLTGTMENPRGSVDIQDGKVSGDSISFVVVRKMQDNEMKINYKGTISGDELKLTMEVNGNAREVTAKRAN
jgi:hypothetical protein